MSHSFEPGDVIVLRPQNDPSNVDYLMSRMGWQGCADSIFEIVRDNEGNVIHHP